MIFDSSILWTQVLFRFDWSSQEILSIRASFLLEGFCFNAKKD